MPSLSRLVPVWLLFAGMLFGQQAPRTHNPHGPLPVSCEACHTATAWAPIRPHPEFDHNTQTAYPLRGMHTHVACGACHIHPVFKRTSTDCASCHADLHRGQMGKNCEKCHTVSGWLTAVQQTRQHADRFPLLGAHATTQCDSCHKGAATGQFQGLSTDCITCHQADFTKAQLPPHTAAAFSQDCTTCHSMNSWRGAKFDHAAVAHFPLTGVHATLDCQSCHMNGKFAGTPAACVNCHLDVYKSTTNPNHTAANFSTDCSVCHNTSTWAGATFDHSKTKFPLTGGHKPLQCNQCHTGGSFASTPANCDACHMANYKRTTNPNHVMDSFPLDCSLCHNTTSWAGASFDHSKTKFPLTGAHTALRCAQCHNGGPFSATPTNCDGCHLADFKKTNNPNHAAAGFPLDCSVCHTTATWAGASFDHSKTRFPLTGAHKPLQCSQCHTGGQFSATSTNCDACHLADFKKTTNPNHVSAGFPLDCSMCHSTTSWAGAAFDHSKTKFPLTGAHTSLQCAQCHTGGSFAAIPANCDSCHLPDFKKTTNPNHVSAGFPLDCSLCHSTTSWAGAVFDHSKTRFPLTGAHTALQCQQCHTGGNFAATPTNCDACHLADFKKTTNPNHVSAGFPLDCSVCHNTASWAGASFDHSKTKFPLTGAHTTLQCVLCHTGGNFAATQTNCDACHLPDYNKTTNPNHVSAGFPKDCSVCHNTISWAGATFDHSKTKFPLTGAHTNLQCSQCHTSGSFAATPTNCDACHINDYNKTTNPSHVAAGFPKDCSICHTTATWANAKFDHGALSGFPLTGAHTTLQCSQCHTGNSFSTAPRTCDGCHLANYKGTTNPNHTLAGFPLDCSVCHSTTSWAGATFDHSKTKFPLTGAHISLQCNQCHTSGSFAATPTNCDACHLADYNKTTNPSHTAAGFPLDCSICHSTTSWAGAVFDHSKTPFPLTGAHVSVPCANCHVGNKFAGTPTDCYSCHKSDYTSVQSPNHIAAGFPTDCTLCHTTSSWLGAIFNHTWFPIYSGSHAGKWTTCADCHINSSNYALFSCITCHQHNQTDTDSHHQDVSGYSYGPTTCYVCHPNGTAGN